jgi:hypothetical protein
LSNGKGTHCPSPIRWHICCNLANKKVQKEM